MNVALAALGAHSGCPWTRMYGSNWVLTERLPTLDVLDDPESICTAGWRPHGATVAHAPIWTTDPKWAVGEPLHLLPKWPRRCLTEGSQCEANAPPWPFCILSVPNAIVLGHGLVINATHRFDLDRSHSGMRARWRSEHATDTLQEPSCNHPMAVKRRIFSLRQPWAENQSHSLFQSVCASIHTLPLHE